MVQTIKLHTRHEADATAPDIDLKAGAARLDRAADLALYFGFIAKAEWLADLAAAVREGMGEGDR
jgi:hypothetical protein